MKIPTNLTDVAILLAWSKPSLEQTWKKFFFLIRRNRPPPLTSNTSLSGGDATLCIMEYISCKCVNYERDFSIYIKTMNLAFLQRFGSSTKIWTKNSCIEMLRALMLFTIQYFCWWLHLIHAHFLSVNIHASKSKALRT